MSQRKNYIVIGGGLAGLSAAIELATHGHSVTVHEQSKILGGRAATHRQQGFAMNIGPHGFYCAGVMKAQFDAWGVLYSGKRPLGKGATFLIADGARHAFPANAPGLLRSTAFSLADKVRIGRLMGKLPAMTANEGESMQTWIARTVSGTRARQFLGALTRLSTYAADLDLLDAQAALRQLQFALKESVLYLDGGWETVVAGLAAKARSLGVAIQLESHIASLDRIAADGIILAVPPRTVEELTARKLPQTVPARAACLDLALRRLPPEAATFALGLDEPTYVSVHSEYATGLAPAGGALVQIAMYLGCGASCAREELERRADLILPGWRAEAAFTRFLPEMTVVHAIPQAARPRPAVDVLGIPGVLIAGDWVGSEAMLADAAVASGLCAARRLAQSAIGKAA